MWHFYLSILLISVDIVRTENEIVLQTKLGEIKGIRRVIDKNNMTVFEFRKIPFAKAPVGDLRFEKPQPYGAWNGTLDGTTYGPSCFQMQGAEVEDLPNKNISEDCLHLNIFVPNEISVSNRKSVMVWIHGGGFIVGQAPPYDASYLATTGDVIVVTIQYRLGAFGFFSKDTIQGNQALRDQIMALQWVKDNIPEYGGDAESITIFGESAGAFSVGLLTIIPQNQGLFQRALMQSGSAISCYTTTTAYSLSENIAAYLKCNRTDQKSSVNCLKNVTANALLEASLVFLSLPVYFSAVYAPMVDNDLLRDTPSNLLANKNSDEYKFFQSLDIVIGTVSGEASLLVDELPYRPVTFNVSEGIPLSFLCDVVAPEIVLNSYNNDNCVSDAICMFYETNTDSISQSRNILNTFSDFVFNIPAITSLNIHSDGGSSGGKQFHYLFSRPSPTRFGAVYPSWFEGAEHAADIVFEFPSFIPGGMFSLDSQDDISLAETFIRYWTFFAKHGNMSVTGLPEWREYDSVNGHYINFDVPVVTGQHLYEKRANFWLKDIPALLDGPTSKSCENEMVLQTKLGEIKGIRRVVDKNNMTVFEFRKIPFAKAPVGDLRFEKPQPYGAWNGTLDGTTYGPSCFQMQGAEVEDLPNKNISEDCLHLNIFVPNEISVSNRKSVMVWIHGGGFIVGQAPPYDASYLATTGDVIVVTIQYRLGAFGFFSKDTIQGNQALRDQIMALQWVKDNIPEYGGDAESITIFGESAGAFSVGLLTIIPQNQGLFQRAIMQSGSAISCYTTTTAYSLSENIAAYLKCNQTDQKSSVNCLKNVTANALLEASLVFLSLPVYFSAVYAPMVDNDLLRDTPSNLLSNKNSDEYKFFQSLDIVIGTVSGEASLLVDELPYRPVTFNVSEGIPLSFLCDVVAPEIALNSYNNDNCVSDAICMFYETNTDSISQSRNILNTFSDFVFNIPAITSLNIHSDGGSSGGKQFHYLFSRPSPTRFGAVYPSWFEGAEHAADIVFEFPSFIPGGMFSLDSQDDISLAETFIRYWTFFAKHGNMSVTGLPEWREYDSVNGHYINFDVPVVTGQHLYEKRANFWLKDIPALLDGPTSKSCENEMVLQTKLGEIKGIRRVVDKNNMTVFEFRKIPFAKAPLGDLRFEKPQPYGAWNGTLDGTTYGPSCFQMQGAEVEDLPNKNISEDCLHLNIFVPNEISVSNRKSVMVWIHGGGFIVGQAPPYDASYLATTGDVIVVTIQYRLGAFGFFSKDTIQGNQALRDQIMALQWVKDNIPSYGGDAESITIFGESAGAFSVGLLTIIPQNQGLFQRAIMQSGSAISCYTTTTAYSLSENIAAYLKCNQTDQKSSVNCLKNVTANALLEASLVFLSLPVYFSAVYAPMVDNDLLRDTPSNLLANKNSDEYKFFQSLDIVIGTVSGEASLLVDELPYRPVTFNVSEGIPLSFLCDVVAPEIALNSYNNDNCVSDAICMFYETNTDSISQSRNILNTFSDFVFNIPAITSLNIHSDGGSSGGKQFHYLFSRPSPTRFGAVYPSWFEGAEHAADIVFEFPSFIPGGMFSLDSQDDISLAETFIRYWTFFAKHGNMSVTGLPEWREYDSVNGHYINFDVPVVTGQHLYEKRANFWLKDIPALLDGPTSKSCENEMVLQTKLGEIKGIRRVVDKNNMTVFEFRKIPFAKAPVGDLRFEKPQPYGAWNGTLDGTTYGPSCFQMQGAEVEDLPNKNISEDCLHLNIFVPNEISVSNRKSVMVWIHGGGFIVGQAPPYDASYLATTGDVIVVTIQYRLGAFGFFSKDTIQGNQALRDQIMALQWVKDNIPSYGGDAESITIFGESAGAFSVGLLTIIPQNQGLFQRAIMQSGSAISCYTTTTAYSLSENIAAYLKCNQTDQKSSVNCLKNVTANALLEASLVFLSLPVYFSAVYAPMVDNDLLRDTPSNLLANKNSDEYKFFQSLDIVIGTVSGEASLLVDELPYRPVTFNVSEGIPLSFLCDVVAPEIALNSYNNDNCVSDAICMFYETNTDSISQSRNILNTFSDFVFNIPAITSLNIHSDGGSSGGKQFHYLFSRPSPTRFGAVYPSWFEGAEHAADIVFEFPSFIPGGMFSLDSQDDISLAETFIRYWTFFAKHGNMSVTGLPEWREYDSVNGHYINFDVPVVTGQHLYEKRANFWLKDIPALLDGPTSKSCENEMVLQTKLGEIKGIRRVVDKNNMTVFEFRKIPFAKAPVGDLRFEKPQPYGAWNGTLDGTTYGPSCFQMQGAEVEDLPNKNISEDCLHLNIFVPNEISVSNRKSVMVWIHGGGFIVGQAPPYDASYLATTGDVIVVTIQYRLGAFGFFSKDTIQGNQALRDQIMALQWVKDNIPSYGGDAESITIFGESAGAFSVGLLTIIPQNQGLFQRAIMQSGSAISCYTTTTAYSLSENIAAYLKCNQTDQKSSVNCLKNVTANALLEASLVFLSLPVYFSAVYAPMVDNDLLRDTPSNLLANKNSDEYKFFQSLDIVIGTVSGEASLLVDELPYRPVTFNVSEGIPLSFLCDVVAPEIALNSYNNDNCVSDAICMFYETNTDSISQSRNILNTFSDFVFNIPAITSLNIHSDGGSSGGKQFHYLFSRPSPTRFGAVYPSWFEGAEHAADIVFEFPSFIPGGMFSLDSQDDISLAETFIRYWTFFAKHGNMSVTGLPEWREYDSVNGHYINFDVPVVTGQHLYEKRANFWLKDIPALLDGPTSKSCENEMVLQTKLGEIKGIRRVVDKNNMTVFEFRKIPFAKAPVGDLRFEKPQPYGAWNGTLDGTTYGPSCFQMQGAEVEDLPNKNISEDCLHLNIFVPNEISVSNRKSVMVWIHGGGFIVGQAPPYDASYLATTGDVIVVTIQYRLGAFGFFSKDTIQGNQALRDQIMALQWVKDNIPSYGGDAESITIFGESAGAFSVGLLTIIPQNQGLFQRAIMQSGSAISCYTTTTAYSLSENIAAYLKCNQTDQKSSVNCLKNVTANALLEASLVFLSLPVYFSAVYAPMVDNDLLRDTPSNLLANKNSDEYKFFQSLDIVIGTVSGEASLLVDELPYRPVTFNVSEGIPLSFLCDVVAPEIALNSYNNDNCVSDAICMFYETNTDSISQSRNILNTFSDFVFNIPAITSLNIHSDGGSSGGKQFHYLFSRPSPTRFGAVYPSWFEGAEHAADIVFEFPSFIPGGMFSLDSQDDISLAETFIRYWTFFAKHGNMSVTGLPEWREYDSVNGHYINFDVPVVTGQHLYEKRANFWLKDIPALLDGPTSKSCENEMVLQTKLGEIKGIRRVVDKNNMTVFEFRKIPFAKAPVGDLRFEKPQPYGAWNGTLDGTTYGPSCFQMQGAEVEDLPNKNISEDCLHLNIFVPNEISVSNRKSVMVWIHGGGFIVGQAPPYDASYLATTGDVIVVTIQYRLGAFGFFSKDTIQGNQALRDQIMALQWVKDNIPSYGGDAESITIFGESAGAFSVGLLTIIPQNQGLFQRAIMQSGSAISCYTTTTAYSLSENIAAYLKCNQTDQKSSVNCLKNVTANALLEASLVFLSLPVYFSAVYAPMVDNDLLRDTPSNLLANKNSDEYKFFQSLDIVIGTVSGEASLLVDELPYRPVTFNVSEGIPLSFLCDVVAPEIALNSYNNDNCVSDAICMFYETNTDSISQSRNILNTFSDFVFNIPAITSLNIHSDGGSSGGKQFHYLFSRPSPTRFGAVYPSWFEGAEHAADIVFEFPSFIPGGMFSLDSQDDISLAETFIRYWTFFAKHGNMSVTGLPEWREYDSVNGHYINFDVPVVTGQHLYEKRANFWLKDIPALLDGPTSKSCENEMVLQTKLGEIKGIRRVVDKNNMTVFEFRKIPFAKAPVGDLRFEKPQPYGAWNGTLDGTTYGPSCFQMQGAEVEDLPNKNISEDCLHLNIFVPNEISVSNRKSVMVWIHGGGFIVGQAPPYDASYLATTGDVIVVTIQYRLGAFGFFSKDTIQGNQALRDQIMALQWVKDNIPSYGGDAESITIFGESAGAFSVGLLTIIPQNQGLFQRAIMQSGSAISCYTTTTAYSLSENIAAYLKCNQTDQKSSVNCLKNVTANALLEASLVFLSLPVYFSAVYAPMVDNDLLRDTPRNLLANKNSNEYKFFQSLDIVIGTVSGEASLLVDELPYRPVTFNVSEGIPLSFLCDVVAPEIALNSYNNDNSVSSAICMFYETNTDSISQSRNILNTFSDFVFNIPAITSLNIHSGDGSASGKQFHYLFSRPSPTRFGAVYPSWFEGAEHAADIVFEFPSFIPGGMFSLDSQDDISLAETFIRYWTFFAKHGNMSVTGLPEWREYDSVNGHYINFDVPVVTGQHLYEKRANFWLEDIPALLDGPTSKSCSLLSYGITTFLLIYCCYLYLHCP